MEVGVPFTGTYNKIQTSYKRPEDGRIVDFWVNVDPDEIVDMENDLSIKSDTPIKIERGDAVLVNTTKVLETEEQKVVDSPFKSVTVVQLNGNSIQQQAKVQYVNGDFEWVALATGRLLAADPLSVCWCSEKQ